MAKNESAALTHARMALDQFIQLSMPERAATVYDNVTRALRENGVNGAADTQEREFKDRVRIAEAQVSLPGMRRSRLPSKCPHCAGPARSDEVDWIDEHSAECAYCGRVIQTEEK